MQAEVYQVITDPDKLKEFIEWLPECQHHEMYYVTLFSRKKYCPDNPACKADKTQLKRFTSTRERLYGKIAQLECKVGAYYGANDLPVPQESLAVYITMNPRDLWKASFKSIGSLASLLESRGKENIGNPHQEVLNTIQTTKSYTRFHVFDVDSKDPEILEKVKVITGGNHELIETRGGYHVLIRDIHVSSMSSKMWYVQMKSCSDVVGDCLTPVPGTYQGGFTPRLIKYGQA